MRALRRLHATLWRAVAGAARALQRSPFAPGPIGHACGVEVFAVAGASAPPASVEKLAAGLALIADVDPRRFRRLARDVRAVALVPEAYLGPLGGGYLIGSGVCYLALAVVDRLSAPEVTLILVHEATHARLDRLRLFPLWPGLRSREERRCLREELAFADRLPRDAGAALEHWHADRRRRTADAVPRRRGGMARAGRAP